MAGFSSSSVSSSRASGTCSAGTKEPVGKTRRGRLYVGVETCHPDALRPELRLEATAKNKSPPTSINLKSSPCPATTPEGYTERLA